MLGDYAVASAHYMGPDFVYQRLKQTLQPGEEDRFIEL